jgi:spore germination cell wall hydrolase CwlJ-like protein
MELLYPTESKSLSSQFDEEEIDCLSKNIYFEARDQPISGQFAVAEVVINRTKTGEFPEDICKVIKQKKKRKCQFSWYCDGKADVMLEKRAATLAKYIAVTVLEKPTNYSKGALYYHANYVAPNWGKKKVATIGDHVFYT